MICTVYVKQIQKVLKRKTHRYVYYTKTQNSIAPVPNTYNQIFEAAIDIVQRHRMVLHLSRIHRTSNTHCTKTQNGIAPVPNTHNQSCIMIYWRQQYTLYKDTEWYWTCHEYTKPAIHNVLIKTQSGIAPVPNTHYQSCIVMYWRQHYTLYNDTEWHCTCHE